MSQVTRPYFTLTYNPVNLFEPYKLGTFNKLVVISWGYDDRIRRCPHGKHGEDTLAGPWPICCGRPEEIGVSSYLNSLDGISWGLLPLPEYFRTHDNKEKSR